MFARRFFVHSFEWLKTGKVDQKKLKHFGSVWLLSSPLSSLVIIAASVPSLPNNNSSIHGSILVRDIFFFFIFYVYVHSLRL